MFTRSNRDPMWHKRRKESAHAFSSIEVNRMMRICSQQLEKWIAQTLEPKIAKNETFDPTLEMALAVFHSILETGLEYKSTDEEYHNFHSNLELCWKEFGLKQGTNPFRIVFGLLIPSRREVFRAAKEVQCFGKKILNAYRTNKDMSTNNTIIKMVINNPAFMSDEEIIAELLMSIIAGHDMAASQLASTIVLLAKHPKVTSKLREEFSGMEQTNWRKPDYLHCIINESERLLPVSAIGHFGRRIRKTFRYKKEDYATEDGTIIIPKGATVMNPLSLLRNNPDMNPTQAMKESFLLFSIGNQNCPGQRLANEELDSCTPLLVSKYNFEVVQEGSVVFFLTSKFQGTKLREVRIV